MSEPRHAIVHYGVTKLVRQGHSVSTNPYLRAVADTAFDCDRYDASMVLSLGINRSKFLIIDNDENQLLSAVQSKNRTGFEATQNIDGTTPRDSEIRFCAVGYRSNFFV
jgi:hypothetical protein